MEVKGVGGAGLLSSREKLDFPWRGSCHPCRCSGVRRARKQLDIRTQSKELHHCSPVPGTCKDHPSFLGGWIATKQTTDVVLVIKAEYSSLFGKETTPNMNIMNAANSPFDP